MSGLAKRSVFRLYHFNEKTRQLDAIETLRTKPLTEKDFKRCLKKELANSPKAIWELSSGWKVKLDL